MLHFKQHCKSSSHVLGCFLQVFCWCELRERKFVAVPVSDRVMNTCGRVGLRQNRISFSRLRTCHSDTDRMRTLWSTKQSVSFVVRSSLCYKGSCPCPLILMITSPLRYKWYWQGKISVLSQSVPVPPWTPKHRFNWPGNFRYKIRLSNTQKYFILTSQKTQVVTITKIPCCHYMLLM